MPRNPFGSRNLGAGPCSHALPGAVTQGQTQLHQTLPAYPTPVPLSTSPGNAIQGAAAVRSPSSLSLAFRDGPACLQLRQADRQPFYFLAQALDLLPGRSLRLLNHGLGRIPQAGDPRA